MVLLYGPDHGLVRDASVLADRVIERFFVDAHRVRGTQTLRRFETVRVALETRADDRGRAGDLRRHDARETLLAGALHDDRLAGAGTAVEIGPLEAVADR